MSTEGLTDFLLARIAEDEAAAREATPGPWEWDDRFDSVSFPGRRSMRENLPPESVVHEGGVRESDGPHIARWGPDRVLAECEAKRRIAEGHAEAWELGREDYLEGVWRSEDHAIRLLAAVYADHPDYREEWRP